jgi:3'-5' exoribonuclease
MSRQKPPSKPTLTSLSELQPGQLGDFFALLAERTKGVTRAGKNYYHCRFRDAKRSAAWMVWSDHDRYEECEKLWQVGQFFKLRAVFDQHPLYGLQLDVQNIRQVTNTDREAGFNEADFLERSRFEPAAMFHELCGLVDSSIEDEALRKLVLMLLARHAEAIKVIPASQRHYFPYPGGWLEHTVNVTKNCIALTNRYRLQYADHKPPLNLDLIVAGAALHELGRVAEFGSPTEEPAAFVPSIPGRLIGHVNLARDMVRDAAREMPGMNPQLLQLLEHLLLSYLEIPDWGVKQSPMIPEVLILHHADELDGKLEMYLRCLRTDVADGPFTERDPIMGKRLLKERLS